MANTNKTIKFTIPFMGCDPFNGCDTPAVTFGDWIYDDVWKYFRMNRDGSADSNPPDLYILEHKNGKFPITAAKIADHDMWNVEPAQNFIKDYYVSFLAEHFNLKGLTLNQYNDSGYVLNVTMPLESLRAFANEFITAANAREKERCSFDNPLQHHTDRVAVGLLRCFTGVLYDSYGEDLLPDYMLTEIVWLCMSIMLTHEGKRIDGSWGLHQGLEALCLADVDSDFTEGLAQAISEVAESFIDNEWLKS